MQKVIFNENKQQICWQIVSVFDKWNALVHTWSTITRFMHTVQSDIFYQGNNYQFALNISTDIYQSLAQSSNKHWHDQIIKVLLIFYSFL